MKTVIARLLALLALNAFFAQVTAVVDHTYINNLSSTKIKASVHYNFAGHAKFTDRIINPGSHADDEYYDGNCTVVMTFVWPIGVVITVLPAGCQTEVLIGCDESVVIFNSPNTKGVDIYVARYGAINDPVYYLHSLKC